jgi:acyl-CoA synthetase (NDP forming)
MGIYNPSERLDTFFLPNERLKRPKRGNVGIVSQSGAILSCLLGAARSSRTGVSKVVGYGNAMDIDESELYEYLAQDEDTDVVVPISSQWLTEKVHRKGEDIIRRTLLILKSGKGKAARLQHFYTAGLQEDTRSFIQCCSVQYQEAMDFDGLMDAAKALSYQRPGRGNRVCIITNGGGSGVLAADECMRQGLEVNALPVRAKEKLGQCFPDFYGYTL